MPKAIKLIYLCYGSAHQISKSLSLPLSSTPHLHFPESPHCLPVSPSYSHQHRISQLRVVQYVYAIFTQFFMVECLCLKKNYSNNCSFLLLVTLRHIVQYK